MERVSIVDRCEVLNGGMTPDRAGVTDLGVDAIQIDDRVKGNVTYA